MAKVMKSLSLAALLAGAFAAPLAADPHHGQGQQGGRGGPVIEINPSDFLARRPRPDVDTRQFIMGEVKSCAAAGVRLFVDCLSHNHGSIMIRRLEACLRSETIPDDPQRVADCLPAAGAH